MSSKTDTDMPMRAGYTRVLSQDDEVLHYEKDGKKFRRFGNKLVEI